MRTPLTLTTAVFLCRQSHKCAPCMNVRTQSCACASVDAWWAHSCVRVPARALTCCGRMRFRSHRKPHARRLAANVGASAGAEHRRRALLRAVPRASSAATTHARPHRADTTAPRLRAPVTRHDRHGVVQARPGVGFRAPIPPHRRAAPHRGSRRRRVAAGPVRGQEPRRAVGRAYRHGASAGGASSALPLSQVPRPSAPLVHAVPRRIPLATPCARICARTRATFTSAPGTGPHLRRDSSRRGSTRACPRRRRFRSACRRKEAATSGSSSRSAWSPTTARSPRRWRRERRTMTTGRCARTRW